MAKNDSKANQELTDKIAYARGLHENAIEQMQAWEETYKGSYTVPDDIADKSLHAFKPARPHAIISKMLAMLSVRAKLQNIVVPRKDTQAEEQICTKLEQYLAGYQWRIQSEKNEPVFRHAVQWGLLRGKVVLLAQYVPRFVDSEYFPIRSIAPDPMTVFEVPGENGVMYFVRDSVRYKMELEKEIDKAAEWNKAGKDLWTKPSKFSDKKKTDAVKLTEYYDGEYYAVLIDDEIALNPTEHGYGFCPIAVTYLEDTPFQEMEWRGQSVLAPVMDALKNDAILMAKLGDAVSSFFWPIGVWQTPDGRAGWVNPSAAGVGAIPVDAKLTFFNPAPNIPIITAYKEWIHSEISIATLPEIAWATNIPQSGAHSGFAISQVLSQVRDRIDDKVENLQFVFGNHFSQVLRLTEKFANRARENKFEVMVMSQENGAPKRALLGIGKDDVDEHYQVLSKLTPSLPTERLGMLQEIKAMRERDPVSKLPLVDDKTLRELYPDIFEHPDRINERVDEEKWEQEIPEIHGWEKDEYYEQWKKDHPPHVSPEMNPEKLSKEELIQRLKMLEMFVQNPQAFASALRALAQQQQGAPPAAIAGAPAQAAGMPTQVMPPQMQSGNPNPLQGGTPEQLAATQAGQAFNPPKP